MKRLTSNRTWEEASKDLSNELGYSYIWTRLNQIENVLGDDYNLEDLKRLLYDRNFKNNAPKPGDVVFYEDEYGSKEYGVIDTVFYEGGELDGFSINFEDADFDEFYGSAWGTVVFPDDRG